MQVQTINPYEIWLNYQEVSLMTALKRNTLLRMIERGEFPKPIRINRQVVKFNRSTIQNWIKAKEDSRNDRH